MVALIIISLIVAVIGVFNLSNATLGVGLIAVACLLGILARILQAQRHHKENIEIVERVNPKASLKRIIPIEEEEEKWLSEDPNAKKELSEKQLSDLIHEASWKENYLKMKFYAERLIKEYPRGNYVPFGQDKLGFANKKLGLDKT